MKKIEMLKNLKPSEYISEPWIQVRDRYCPTEFSGKWCIIGEKNHIDSTWIKVIDLFIDKKIKCAKVRSAYNPNILAYEIGIYHSEAHTEMKTSVICIYVEDHRDKEEIFKIRDYLRSAGIKDDLKLKSDKATAQGIYSGDEKEFLIVDSI